MKIEPPEQAASADAWHEYAVQVHKCVEDGRDENRRGFRRLRMDGSINVVAMAALFLTLAGMLIAGVRWADRVDAKLDLIPEIVAASHDHDGRLNHIDGKLADLQSALEAARLRGPRPKPQ